MESLALTRRDFFRAVEGILAFGCSRSEGIGLGNRACAVYRRYCSHFCTASARDHSCGLVEMG